MAPWISVITVVKDDPEGFARTAVSLLNQSMADFEWIVIDSSSAEIHPTQIMKYTWTEPKGVFPAMNIGLQQAMGEYVYFLNAGDVLHDPESLANARKSMVVNCDALIGRVQFIYSPKRSVVPSVVDIERESKHFFARGLFPPHQGLVTRRALLYDVGGFNEDFTVASDYEVFLKLTARASFCTTNSVLADFYVGGLSTTNWLTAHKEFHQARITTLRLGSFDRIREFAWTARGVFSSILVRMFGRV